MTYLLTAGIALITAVASVFGVYNYLPLSILQPAPEARFGSTVTTINGTDTLSSSRTTINTNFSNLNAGKLELSDWYATTSATQITALGTITTGTWSGTAILPAKGGTGSTTLSANQVLLGNGTGNIGSVAGWGTSGQFLTSNGGTSAPTWQTGAVDQTANYNWTGTNLFKNFNASSTVANPITLNGLSYSTPSARGASGAVLMEDGAGALSWSRAYSAKQYITATAVSQSQTSSTTVLSTTIPANTLGTSNGIRCEFGLTQTAGQISLYVQNTATLWIDWSYGSGTSTVAITQSSGGAQGASPIVMYLLGAGATNSQKLYYQSYGFVADASYLRVEGTATFSVDSTADNLLKVVAKASGANTYFAPDATVCTVIR